MNMLRDIYFWMGMVLIGFSVLVMVAGEMFLRSALQ
jgi:hypothetical protein